MRLGCALAPVRLGGGPVGPGSIEEWARTAEGLGYSSLWTFDAVGRGFMLSEKTMCNTLVVGESLS